MWLAAGQRRHWTPWLSPTECLIRIADEHQKVEDSLELGTTVSEGDSTFIPQKNFPSAYNRLV